MKGDAKIMFRITEEEYGEMVGVISKCCCFKPHKCSYCSEVDCDVHMIYEILQSHLERRYIKPDKEKSDIGQTEKEFTIDWDEDKLPFRV